MRLHFLLTNSARPPSNRPPNVSTYDCLYGECLFSRCRETVCSNGSLNSNQATIKGKPLHQLPRVHSSKLGIRYQDVLPNKDPDQARLLKAHTSFFDV